MLSCSIRDHLDTWTYLHHLPHSANFLTSSCIARRNGVVQFSMTLSSCCQVVQPPLVYWHRPCHSNTIELNNEEISSHSSIMFSIDSNILILITITKEWLLMEVRTSQQRSEFSSFQAEYYFRPIHRRYRTLNGYAIPTFAWAGSNKLVSQNLPPSEWAQFQLRWLIATPNNLLAWTIMTTVKWKERTVTK